MTSFVDTNILLYAISRVPSEAGKRAEARRLLATRSCTFSMQVFNEFVSRATHSKFLDPMSVPAALRLIDIWRRFPVQPIDNAVFDAARDINSRTNYSWWDCLILGAARTIGSTILLSEDMQHGHVIDGVRIENPFRDLA